MSTRNKIWLGVGAAVFAGTTPLGAAPVNDTQVQQRPADFKSQASMPAIIVAQHGRHGGEAGEGGEGEGGEGGAGASLPPELGFAFGIAQMRGHLSIAEELLKAGNRGAALTHFQHPQQEVYGRLRGQLKQFGVAPFEASLKLLVATVRERKDAESYANARKALDDALAAAEAAVTPKQGSAVFALETALELIKLSAHEYQEAVKKGRIVNPVEYQDGRGFASAAERMIEGAAAELDKKDAAALAKLRAALAELKKAWPSATPPKTPVKDYSAVLSDVARIELASGPLLKD
jgi:hypothetical protein